MTGQPLPFKSRAIEYLNSSELSVREVIDGKDYVFNRRKGQWHSSTGPAIVNEAGRIFMIHGIAVNESILALWNDYSKRTSQSPDDPETLRNVLAPSAPGEPFERRLRRTILNL